MENFSLLNDSNMSSIFENGANDDDDRAVECSSLDSVESFSQFFTCFRYFVSKSVLTSCCVLVFACATVLLNTAVILFIHRLRAHKTVFDRIFIGHCVVDALVGLLVIPNYCIYIVFGYWPLGKLLCHFYVSLDYTICHVGILHMVFVAYARLRSLLAPKKYHKEWIILHAKLTMLVLWIISSLLWLPAVNLIINLSFKSRECYFTYHPAYIIVQDSVAYLLPMFVILGITGYILYILHKRNKRRKQLRRRKKMRLPKLIAQERRKIITKSIQNATAVVVKIAENFSTSDVSEFNSETAGAVTVVAAQSSSLSPNEETILRLKCKPDENKLKRPGMSPRRGDLIKQASNATSNFESSYTGLNSMEDDTSSIIDRQTGGLKKRIKSVKCARPKLNAYAKLYLIIATFCILWLPFCILWPINAVCETCISSLVYQLSYWMGYGQSLINPILLLILNPNYNKLKADSS